MVWCLVKHRDNFNFSFPSVKVKNKIKTIILPSDLCECEILSLILREDSGIWEHDTEENIWTLEKIKTRRKDKFTQWGRVAL